MQTHTDAIGDFFHRIRGSRRPPAPASPPPIVEPIAPTSGTAPHKTTRPGSGRAYEAQHKRRNQVEAEKLLPSFIRDLKSGDYAYRYLKDQFDLVCEECGLDAVSDHLVGKWLRRLGLRRFEVGRSSVVMYAIAPRRSSPRLVAA